MTKKKAAPVDPKSIIAISKEEGVRDLPMSIRGPFAQALKAERLAGETTEDALHLLDKAIAAEEKAARQ